MATVSKPLKSCCVSNYRNVIIAQWTAIRIAHLSFIWIHFLVIYLVCFLFAIYKSVVWFSKIFYNSLLPLVNNFWGANNHRFGQWEALLWLLYPYGMPSSCFYLIFRVCFLKDLLYLFCLVPILPCPWISRFTKDYWFLFMGNGIRDQDLGARCAHNCWVSLVLGPFSRQRKYVHLHTQMHPSYLETINSHQYLQSQSIPEGSLPHFCVPPSTVRTLAPNHIDTCVHLSGPVMHLK